MANFFYLLVISIILFIFSCRICLTTTMIAWSQSPMMLLDRYYSSYDNLFKRAVQAQVCECIRFKSKLSTRKRTALCSTNRSHGSCKPLHQSVNVWMILLNLEARINCQSGIGPLQLDMKIATYQAVVYSIVIFTQVLITDQSGVVLNELRKLIPVMNQMVSSKLTQDQTKVMTDILQKMIG